MPSYKRLIACLLSLVLISGCTPFKVSTDYNPDLNIANWKTYQWQLDPIPSDDPYDNDLNRNRVTQAINQELTKKGFSIKASQPDFKISYFFLVESKVDVHRIHNHCPWIHCGYGSYETYVSQYKYGSLIIDLIDAKTNELQWRGIVGARVTEGATPQEKQENIKAAIQYLMQEFPPEAHKLQTPAENT